MSLFKTMVLDFANLAGECLKEKSNFLNTIKRGYHGINSIGIRFVCFTHVDPSLESPWQQFPVGKVTNAVLN